MSPMGRVSFEVTNPEIWGELLLVENTKDIDRTGGNLLAQQPRDELM